MSKYLEGIYAPIPGDVTAVDLEMLPEGIELTDLTVTPDGIDLVLTGTNVSM